MTLIAPGSLFAPEPPFKFHRQATNEIAGVSDEAAPFLEKLFQRRSC